MQAWVIGNWKQNPATSDDVQTLLSDLLATADKDDGANSAGCQLMVAPSCIHLASVSTHLQDSPVLCAAQDISAHSGTTGAYTGIAPRSRWQMLAQLGHYLATLSVVSIIKRCMLVYSVK